MDEKRYEPEIGYEHDFIIDNRFNEKWDIFKIAEELNYYDSELNRFWKTFDMINCMKNEKIRELKEQVSLLEHETYTGSKE